MKSAANCHSIEEIREEIDRIDQEIITLISERHEFIKAIVRFKEQTMEGIVAKERFDAVLASRRQMAGKCGLNPDMVEKLYRDMMNYFIEEEMKLVKNK
jgi:isochorismate pyruvate lyase